MNKGHSYFELLDALKESGCPICRLVQKDSRRYLDHLMYESVLDVPTRMQLMGSFGLCSWHAWQLPSLPPVCSPDTGFSIFASDLLRKFSLLAVAITERSHQKRGLKSFLRKKVSQFLSKIKEKSCPACLHVGQFESYHLKELADFIEEDFLQAYRASQGICLPHFFLLQENCSSHPNFPLLLELQLVKSQSLRGVLEEFIRKQDYRFQHKITSEEAKAWRVAMEFLAGKPGIFTNEIGHDLLQRSRAEGISPDKISLALTSFDRLTFRELIGEMKTAKEITLYLKEPLPADLFEDLKRLLRREQPTIEVVVEGFSNIGYLQGLHAAGFSLFYGLGLPAKTIVFLGRKRGFLIEDAELSSARVLRLLKRAEDLYFSLLWRRFGVAVLLSGSIKETDKEKKLFCLIVEGGRLQWCRFKDADTKELPEVGAQVEVFAWEKWNSHILEILELRVLELEGQTAP